MRSDTKPTRSGTRSSISLKPYSDRLIRSNAIRLTGNNMGKSHRKIRHNKTSHTSSLRQIGIIPLFTVNNSPRSALKQSVGKGNGCCYRCLTSMHVNNCITRKGLHLMILTRTSILWTWWNLSGSASISWFPSLNCRYHSFSDESHPIIMT